MLGQPSSMPFLKSLVACTAVLSGGAAGGGGRGTETRLTVTEMLRKKGVVGKFVEFYGFGAVHAERPDRATMEHGPRVGATRLLPVDKETLAYLQFTARSAEQIASRPKPTARSRCSSVQMRRPLHVQ